MDVRGSAGVGVLLRRRCCGRPPTRARWPRLVERLRAACGVGTAGRVVVLDAPADVKAAVDVWGPVAALDLMRAGQGQFDPERRLAPGRFVGGI